MFHLFCDYRHEASLFTIITFYLNGCGRNILKKKFQGNFYEKAKDLP
jgi:hypothetical protein